VYYDSFYSSKLLSNTFLVIVATQANFKDVRNIEGGITAYAAQVDPTVVKKT
jgi:rhodanese-related sulfurtransferase